MSISTGTYATLTHCLVAVSIDRYWAICHPVSYQNSKGMGMSRYIILFCWILGMVTGFMPVFGLSNKEFAGHCNMTNIVDIDYLLAMTVFTCCGSIVTMVILYSLIYYRIVGQASSW